MGRCREARSCTTFSRGHEPREGLSAWFESLHAQFSGCVRISRHSSACLEGPGTGGSRVGAKPVVHTWYSAHTSPAFAVWLTQVRTGDCEGCGKADRYERPSCASVVVSDRSGDANVPFLQRQCPNCGRPMEHGFLYFDYHRTSWLRERPEHFWQGDFSDHLGPPPAHAGLASGPADRCRECGTVLFQYLSE